MTTRKLLSLAASPMSGGTIADLEAAGWHVLHASNTEQAAETVRQERPRVGLVHFDRAALSGSNHHLADLIMRFPHMKWVGAGDSEVLADQHIGEFITRFLYDYHTLPTDAARLRTSLGHAYGMAALESIYSNPAPKPVNRYSMVALSPIMHKVFTKIDKIAAADVSVLVTGESGTGKELVARAIHRESTRASGPFVAVNCGSIPAPLIQSELFGHEKGAFTGAHKRQIGRIESANGGTILLDEIADLPLSLQVNLLRFLQERVIERVGGVESIPVDVRVIAATHRDVQTAVAEGEFREDLYYRLRVLSLNLPPLRERPEDIEQLANYYFDQFRLKYNPGLKGFSSLALHQMAEYSWPGNVRELKNKVERAVVMCEQRFIEPEDLELDWGIDGQTFTLSQARAEAECLAVKKALCGAGYNVSKAARQLGVARVTLYRLMQKYDLEVGQPDTVE